MNDSVNFPKSRYRDAPVNHPLATRAARWLGWFSVGLGLLELARPKTLAATAGVAVPPALVRGYGARELAVGAALLSNVKHEPWLWMRVAGDVLDIATAARAGAGRRNRTTLLMLLGVTAVDVLCAAAMRHEKTALKKRPAFDYSDRSGFPQGLQPVRGVAASVYRSGFEAPPEGETRAPQPLLTQPTEPLH